MVVMKTASFTVTVIVVATTHVASSFNLLPVPPPSLSSYSPSSQSPSTIDDSYKDVRTSTSTTSSLTPFTTTRLYASIATNEAEQQASSSPPTATATATTTGESDSASASADKESSPQSSPQSPAEYENQKFACDETVEFWKNFQRSGLFTASENLLETVAVSNRFIAKGGDALNYWLRHNARSGYFFTNAVLGVTASNLHEQLIVRSSSSNDDTNTSSSSNNNDSNSNTNSPTFANSLVRSQVITRLLLEVALTYEQDYHRIENGKYKVPYDMYNASQQTSPLYALEQTSRFVREAVGTLTRRNRGSEDDKRIWISSNVSIGADTTSDLYPKYYRTAFHYQTDGWMSSDSAKVYDTSTETLFLGRQDAMQRTALVPLLQHYADINGDSVGSDSSNDTVNDRKPMKVLEVACGTGRFMTFARDNLPLDAEYTALDLSPYYLDRARQYDAEWRTLKQRQKQRDKNEKDNGTSSSSSNRSNTKDKIHPASIVQGQAENLPFNDNEFDAVVCIYLFHELPRHIRAQAASEMARVTKPGGTVILTDSTQIGDRPVFDGQIGNFEKMNEPYYRDYIIDYLPDHFERVGMECKTKTVCSASKTLAFRKIDKEEI